MPSSTIRKKKLVIAITITAVIITVLVGLITQRLLYLDSLRSEMDAHVTDAVAYIEQGSYNAALICMEEAREPAIRLRDADAEEMIGAYIRLIDTVIQADGYFQEEYYQSALEYYMTALWYAAEISSYDTRYIDDMVAISEKYIYFYETIESADSLAAMDALEEALAEYNEAARMAAVLSFSEGVRRAGEGIEQTEERIALEKQHAAMLLEAQAFLAELSCLADDVNAGVGSSVDVTYTGENQESTYDFNRSLYFDLKTMIDSQNSPPMSLIKMGSIDGSNEGWYNGCGWIAAYNILIMLGNPQHPADIVRYFEANEGTVMDGLFGTYPYAIEMYLTSLGYSVEHTLFPRVRLSVDDEIRANGAGILAYAHTSAAHYVAIEYRESDGMFIIYNDSSAKARSRNLGLTEETSIGAVIDSVDLWIAQTPEILFSFSLITVPVTAS